MKALTTILALLLLATNSVQAERIKDLASIQGVRDNELVGYGLIGLHTAGEVVLARR